MSDCLVTRQRTVKVSKEQKAALYSTRGIRQVPSRRSCFFSHKLWYKGFKRDFPLSKRSNTKMSIPDFVRMSDPSMVQPYRGIADYFPEIRDLRANVQSLYYLSDTRLRIGSRLLAHVRQKNDVPRNPLEPSSAEIERLVSDIRHKFPEDLSSLATKSPVRRTVGRSSEDPLPLPPEKDSPPRPVMSDFTEISLAKIYDQHRTYEHGQERLLAEKLEEFQIWTEYLKKVRGVGPRLGSVLISFLDPFRSVYSSSFIRYCGLDVVVQDEVDKKLKKTGKYLSTRFPSLATELEEILSLTIDDQDELVERIAGLADLVPSSQKVPLRLYQAILTDLLLNTGRGRSRRPEHLVTRTFTDQNGKTREVKGLSHNPFVKTKTVEVLATSMIMATGQYKSFYNGYLHRLESTPRHQFKAPAHLRRMANRYMIKRFLIDLHTVWRRQLGLVVMPMYNEEKLGMHHVQKPLWQSIVSEADQAAWPKRVNLAVFNRLATGK